MHDALDVAQDGSAQDLSGGDPDDDDGADADRIHAGHPRRHGPQPLPDAARATGADTPGGDRPGREAGRTYAADAGEKSQGHGEGGRTHADAGEKSQGHGEGGRTHAADPAECAASGCAQA
jgi:hypothetical protein